MVKVLTHNLAGSIQTEEVAREFVEQIKPYDVDAAVFPETFNVGQEEGAAAAAELFRGLGYAATYFANEDIDGRSDARGMLAISRVSVWKMPGYSRNFAAGVAAIEGDMPVRFAGVHHPDPRASVRELKSTDRLDVKAVVDHLNYDETQPAVVIGDFNALHRSDPRAWLYSAGRLIPSALSAEPRIGQNERDPKVIMSKAQRIGKMATRPLVSLYKEAGFVDADSGLSKAPTASFVGGLAKAQLDRAMSRGLEVVSHRIIDMSDVPTEHKAVLVSYRPS